MGKLQVIHNY